MSQEIGLAIFGLLQAAVGAAMLLWPRRMRSPWAVPRDRRADARAERGALITQRLIGLVFLVMGSLVTDLGLTEGAAVLDATRPGTRRVVSSVFAAVWSLIGVAMALWPAQVRDITNPDRADVRDPWRGASSLAAYRITGLTFIAIGGMALLTLMRGG